MELTSDQEMFVILDELKTTLYIDPVTHRDPTPDSDIKTWFKRVNDAGWTNWFSLNFPGLDRFASALCFLGKPEAAVPPILVFSYDYVSPIQDNLPPESQGVETGRNRLRGRFYWSLAFAHAADLLIITTMWTCSSTWAPFMIFRQGRPFPTCGFLSMWGLSSKTRSLRTSPSPM